MIKQSEEVTLGLIGQKVDTLTDKVDKYIEKMDKRIFYYDKMQIEFGIFKWMAGISAGAFIVQIVLVVSNFIFKGR